MDYTLHFWARVGGLVIVLGGALAGIAIALESVR